LAYTQQFGVACAIARCFAFVGPLLPLDRHFAIGNFVRDAMSGNDIEIRGDGTPRRSYMYAADLVRWLLTMLLRAPAGQAFNVGSARSLSIQELAESVRGSLGSTASVKILGKVQQNAPLQQYVPSVHKAERQLGLSCEISLEEAIRKTARWHGWK
jgi:dTDP-glucose 4,6-dehydratase